MLNIDTIYKLTPHCVRNHKTKHRYPTYKLYTYSSSFFHTVEEAELFLKDCPMSSLDAYCYSLSELPMGMDFLDGDSFSERIYFPNGQLWGVRDYANISPVSIPAPYTEIEFDNDIYGRCLFTGRDPEEIRFKRGDIIEIFCYGASKYWSRGKVELAIVVDTPPSKEEMTRYMESYLKDKSNCLTGDRGFDLGIRFNARYDAYTVIPAYVPTNTAVQDLTDHCDTFCAMQPHYKVSQRIQTRLHGLLERYLEAVNDGSIREKQRTKRLDELILSR